MCRESTNKGAARKFGVDWRQIREWRKRKDDLEGLSRGLKERGTCSPRHGGRIGNMDRRPKGS